MMEKYLRTMSLNFIFSEARIPHGSYIWNGILKEYFQAKSKEKQKVGNGESSISFWQDNWLSQGPLIDHPNYERLADLYIRRLGLKFSDYRAGPGWKDLSLVSQDLKPLMTTLNAMILNNKRYEIIWGDNSNGLFSFFRLLLIVEQNGETHLG